MADNKTIHFIPPLPPKREKRVGIYCRVSTNSAEQLKSLTAQVSALTRLTAANPKWLLVDVYIDIASSKTGSSRKEFNRMLKDCKSRDIEIVLTKSISIWQGCVVRLDVGREIDCYCNDKSRFEWLIIFFFHNRHEKVCYFFWKVYLTFNIIHVIFQMESILYICCRRRCCEKPTGRNPQAKRNTARKTCH